MQPPLVSVIISAYRQPAFLNQALASVSAQTYPNLEILIVDDASGEEFTRDYQLPPNAQLLIHPTNRAAAAASRNTGIAAAKGKYIAFLDQDDLWLPEKIAAQVEALEKNPDALLHFVHYKKVDENLHEFAKQPAPIKLKNPIRQMLVRNFIDCPSQVMMPRSALDRLGPFDENIRGASDWDMWLRAVAHGQILASPLPLACYRQHSQQWSNSGVMVATAGVAVLEKARGWLIPLYPKLRPLLKRRLARWLREIARVQLDREIQTHLALGNLLRAVRTWPLSFRAYFLMPRALLVSRTQKDPA